MKKIRIMSMGTGIGTGIGTGMLMVDTIIMIEL
jgi:hypothetical protein